MKPVPPILRPDDMAVSVLDDIRDAVSTYCREYTYTSAFDELVTTPASAAVPAQLLERKCSAADGLRCLHKGLLGKWGSARSLTVANSPLVAKGLEKTASLLHGIPGSTRIGDLSNEQLEVMVDAFEALDHCKGIGATIASKIIGALRPAAAIMWDTPIASAYGFAHSTAGYRRFLHLMRDVAARLQQLSNGRDLEAYLRPDGRSWRAPLAKVIDEWHWVRITREHRYCPPKRMKSLSQNPLIGPKASTSPTSAVTSSGREER